MPARPALWMVVQALEEPKRDPKRLWRTRLDDGWTPKTLGRKPELNVIPSRLPFAKSTAKGPPFSMRGLPAIAANPREGSRLLRFWVKVPNTSSEIGTTLSRARACGRMQD